MFAPEFTHKKCPWWHKLFRRFKWFKCWRCCLIEFKGMKLPFIATLMPTLDLGEIANIQPLNDSVASIFYLDLKYGGEKK